MDKNDPSAADAVRIEPDVEQFWGWATPGLSAGHLECEVRVLINAPIASFDSGAYVAGNYRQPAYDLSDENRNGIPILVSTASSTNREASCRTKSTGSR
jgi:hypothetical protein